LGVQGVIKQAASQGQIGPLKRAAALHSKIKAFDVGKARNKVKFLIDNWTLVLVALTSGGLLLWPAIRGAAGGSLTATGAVQLINHEKAVVIDVCEDQEYAAGHVSGAKHIPLGQLAKRLPEVVKNKDLPVIFVCQSGMRSRSASNIAKGLGYPKAQSLGGGLSGWRAANLPVERS
jgi:rhodanese-related sulfurtransferase